jgi:hypothetical protein
MDAASRQKRAASLDSACDGAVIAKLYRYYEIAWAELETSAHSPEHRTD